MSCRPRGMTPPRLADDPAPGLQSEVSVDSMNDRRSAVIGALYQRYGGLLRRRCRHFLRDDAAVEDAVQTTFLKLLGHYDRHGHLPEPEETLRLIYRITANCCFDMLRGRNRLIQQGHFDELPEIEGDSLESRIVAADVIRQLLADLPQPLFEVAWFYYADGMTQDEIAEVLGIGRRAVAARMARFRQILLRRRRKAG